MKFITCDYPSCPNLIVDNDWEAEYQWPVLGYAFRSVRLDLCKSHQSNECAEVAAPLVAKRITSEGAA